MKVMKEERGSEQDVTFRLRLNIFLLISTQIFSLTLGGFSLLPETALAASNICTMNISRCVALKVRKKILLGVVALCVRMTH